MGNAFRGIVCGFCLTGLAAISESADKQVRFSIRPQFGVAMPEFRRVRELLNSFVAGSGVTQVSGETGMAMAVGLEGGYLLKPELGDKGRLGVFFKGGMLTGELKATGTGLSAPVVGSLKNRLITLAGGIWAEGGRGKGFHYRSGVGFGLGLASSTANYSGPGFSTSYPLSGSGLVFDVSGEWGYAVQKDIRIYLQAGYLVANIKKMGLSSSVDFNKDGVIGSGEAEGSLLSDTRGRPLAFNFSGPRSQLGFAVGF